MERQILHERLIKIRTGVSRMTQMLDAMQDMDLPFHEMRYRHLSLEAALLAERTACSIRNLVFDADLISRPKLLLQSAHTQGIEVSHSNGIVTIHLPGLLPKRSSRINTAFLTEPLYACLEEYEKKCPLPRYHSCVVCFLHVYDYALPSRRVRDYDNLECKQLLDTAAAFLMTDDSGLMCDLYHTTLSGDQDCTMLVIMDKSRFPSWLEQQKEHENGSEPCRIFKENPGRKPDPPQNTAGRPAAADPP
ncbi:MAG TPA: hypothetical protein H9761_05785 [Candidatus Eisenbergiella merdavium]|uniref:Uncharacterized protein n=1 Tax=Candidatus Eisenbergiella merdavium TaxID=2838551 RepID=A0A9D2NF04_9FIRM|nr:hypothetical protein [Candidatus Eisenbergiella merdavium]